MVRRRVILDKQQIIDTSFGIIKNEGVESFTARRLARELNISPMTVYNYMKNIDEIKKEVIKKGLSILYKMIFQMIESKEKDLEKEGVKLLCKILAINMMKFALENKEIYSLMLTEYGHKFRNDPEIHSYINFLPQLTGRLKLDQDKLQGAKRGFYIFEIVIKGLIVEKLQNLNDFSMDEYYDFIDFSINSLILQRTSETEMNAHLDPRKQSPEGDNADNSRNSHNGKTILIKPGKIENEIPRHLNDDLISVAGGLEDQIITMYAKGMTTLDIKEHMRNVYGVDVSYNMVSKVKDKILALVDKWQSRPLEHIYPIVYLDSINFKASDGYGIINKAAYSVMGINMAGRKDILGIWIGENESADFWLGVCNDLKSRGVRDILIACKDGLSGFSEAINKVFPKTEIQLCIIHKIRNSMKYVPWKEQKELIAGLKKVYQAQTIKEAKLGFEVFKEKWGKKHPLIVSSWEKNWPELTTFFKYPYEIRKIIYTINIIEGYHRQLRKATRAKATYPTDEVLRNIVYLATVKATKKWTLPVREWRSCISQFAIHFSDRLEVVVG